SLLTPCSTKRWIVWRFFSAESLLFLPLVPLRGTASCRSAMTTSDIAEPSRETVRKASLAGFLGTAVEAYDFIVFTYIIVYLAPLFFPGDDPVTGVLNALLVLGTGFLARPIGGIVFGRIGD